MSKRKNDYSITLDDDPILHRIITKITGINSLPYACPKNLLNRGPSFEPKALYCDIHLGEDIFGLDYIPKFREYWPYCPIIVMTSDSNSMLIGQALAHGANDFIKKPLDHSELIGRTQARIIELNAQKGNDTIEFGDITFNSELKNVVCGDKHISLGNLESKLLSYLCECRGITTPKEVIRGKLWGQVRVSNNTLDKKVSSLRSSLSDLGSKLKLRSIYGGGIELKYDTSEEIPK